jgi:TATA-box binding protein (TBP) (component of TFIID and TFIIIB)
MRTNSTSTEKKAIQRLRQCHTEIHDIIKTLDGQKATTATKVKISNIVCKLSNTLAEL